MYINSPFLNFQIVCDEHGIRKKKTIWQTSKKHNVTDDSENGNKIKFSKHPKN